MRASSLFFSAAALGAALAGCSSEPSATPAGSGGGGGGGSPGPAWLEGASVLVSGHNVENADCRTGICRHNENTDMTLFQGAMYLVHRTAMSQVLGPNSSLNIYRSTD